MRQNDNEKSINAISKFLGVLVSCFGVEAAIKTYKAIPENSRKLESKELMAGLLRYYEELCSSLGINLPDDQINFSALFSIFVAGYSYGEIEGAKDS